MVNKATSTVTLTSSLNPSIFAQSVVFTKMVAPQFGGSPTGTVTFKNGTTSLGTATLVSGVATLTTTTLVVGTASITAVYNGSTSFSGSTSSALSQVVNKATSTVTLTSSLNPSIFAQSVVFTATVAPQFGGSPTGTVTFKNGSGTTMGTVTLAGGVVVFTTTTMAVGTQSITAVYNGSTSFSGSTSSALSQVVNPGLGQASTTVTLISPQNPSTFGQEVTLTATVVSSSGTPTGTVTFSNGSTSLGTIALIGGVAYLAGGSTTTLATGTQYITAVYSGEQQCIFCQYFTAAQSDGEPGNQSSHFNVDVESLNLWAIGDVYGNRSAGVLHQSHWYSHVQ